jgi:NRPS condensation-like uncharacterized protein
MITLHHIATDGWSMAVLQNDLAALYEAKVCEDLGSGFLIFIL